MTQQRYNNSNPRYDNGYTKEHLENARRERVPEKKQATDVQIPRTQRPVEQVPYVNDIVLSGTLGKDMEIQSTQSGKFFIKGSMASWMGKDADTIWFDLAIWEDGISKTIFQEIAALKKGTKVVASGRLRARVYQDTLHWSITCSDVQANRANKENIDMDKVPF